MSASGFKQTYRWQLANVRFTPESRHSEAQEQVGLKKRTFATLRHPPSHPEHRSGVRGNFKAGVCRFHWAINAVITFFW